MIRFLFSFFVMCVFAVGGVFMYFYSEVKYDMDSIVNYHPTLTTQIYDRNDKLIANVFEGENRVYVTYEEIPGRVIEALVAIEDTNFFEHKGINLEAIFRAIIKDIETMSFAQGASTITQQLIKNVALSNEKKIDRKIKEFILAMKLENELSKEQILERYFNEVYFGHGYYGIKTASLGYFHKELNELSLKEISMLVGLPKAPSSYDPTKHLDLSLSRANRVITRMYEIGWIGRDEYEVGLKEEPVVYDDSLTQNKAPYVVDEVIKEANRFLPNLRTGGYKIYTSVDLEVQDMARKSLVDGYNEILKRNKDANASILNGAITVTDPLTGDILALVGGVDYAKSNFNRATQSKRQTGSSFKPFIYQIALNEGYSPVSEVADIPRSFDDGSNKEWNPKNFGKKYDGYITMREALKKSRNLATVNLMYSLGVENVINKLRDAGFRNMPYALSVALGSYGISPLEYSRFYSMFAGGGVATTPKFIKKAVSFTGNETLFEAEKTRITQPEQAYLVVNMMQEVVNSGTARRAKVKGIQVAGKTGTSNDSIDTWFCGYTPEVLVIIWYGNDNYTPMRNVETGGRTAAPVFAEFMNKYLEAFPETKRNFKVPSGVFHKIYKGKDELYTKTSPLPTQDTLPQDIGYSDGTGGGSSLLF
ncbi:transglycosylase domain-containing protein [Campylobacter geochelonis]|uniref:transglycosylase domain-containing protein n=1 Tax=Campylobacter geochelonis TaxID=1780362 RepID=UPI00077083F3|nr:PBP1A family penicillin-binding protein [Campylobacter geochelonis]CZE51210.1 penicillin-binding protein 1A (PBP-1a) (PBP1a) (penicillin-bindingprotein A) [Campylobacter geochelonis]